MWGKRIWTHQNNVRHTISRRLKQTNTHSLTQVVKVVWTHYILDHKTSLLLILQLDSVKCAFNQIKIAAIFDE